MSMSRVKACPHLPDVGHSLLCVPTAFLSAPLISVHHLSSPLAYKSLEAPFQRQESTGRPMVCTWAGCLVSDGVRGGSRVSDPLCGEAYSDSFLMLREGVAGSVWSWQQDDWFLGVNLHTWVFSQAAPDWRSAKWIEFPGCDLRVPVGAHFQARKRCIFSLLWCPSLLWMLRINFLLV